VNSRMDSTKLENAFGLMLSGWEQDLALCLDAGTSLNN